MLELLSSFVPFFALVLLGWAAARLRWLPIEGIGALNTFVLFFGLPAMVFRLAAGGALLQPGLAGLLWVYGLAGGMVVGLGLLVFSRAGRSRRDAGLAALVTVFPNTGFLGLPLLTGLLGAPAAGPVAATLLIDVLVLSSLCLAWAHTRPDSVFGPAGGVSEPNGGAVAAAARSLRGALRNPLLWSMVAGMAMAALGWRLPGPVDETVRLLGQAASPTALFTLGAVLARAQQAGASRVAGGRRDPVAGSVLLKLAVHPALVWVVGRALQGHGLPITDGGLTALVLAAALPSASNVSMLAEREAADTALVVRIILWSTCAGVLSLAIWAHVLGVKPVAPV